jgi:glycine betaine/proline transport system permease protein
MSAAAATAGTAPRVGVDPALLPWCGLLALTAACLALKAELPWLVTYPAQWTLPLAAAINTVADAVVPATGRRA